MERARCRECSAGHCTYDLGTPAPRCSRITGGHSHEVKKLLPPVRSRRTLQIDIRRRHLRTRGQQVQFHAARASQKRVGLRSPRRPLGRCGRARSLAESSTAVAPHSLPRHQGAATSHHRDMPCHLPSREAWHDPERIGRGHAHDYGDPSAHPDQSDSAVREGAVTPVEGRHAPHGRVLRSRTPGAGSGPH